jgi:hypothetical protein
MVCVLLSCTRERLEDRIQEHSIRRTLEKMVLHSWKWSFVNNPTGRNKLVFSSEEPVYYIRTNKYWLLHSKSAHYEILTPRLLMQLMEPTVEEISYPNIWLNATMEKYVYKSNWVDTRFQRTETKELMGMIWQISRMLAAGRATVWRSYSALASNVPAVNTAGFHINHHEI